MISDLKTKNKIGANANEMTAEPINIELLKRVSGSRGTLYILMKISGRAVLSSIALPS